MLEAAEATRSLVVCLAAPAEIAAQRVAEREPDSWPGKAALVEHSRELAETIPALPGIDAVLRTDGTQVSEVAAEVLGLARDRWPELFAGSPAGSPCRG